MQPRKILAQVTTPDGFPMEVAVEGGQHVIRIRGKTLMSSATSGSEREMARIAAEALGNRPRLRVLIGGLGMGFTCRAALDTFPPTAQITVAELFPAIIELHQGVLAPLAEHPLRSERVVVEEVDVREPVDRGGWDAILLDVDNGPDAFTVRSNAGLYSQEGVNRLARALKPDGILVVWSAAPSPPFLKAMKKSGLHADALRVFARRDVQKGGRHTLFVGRVKSARRTESRRAR